MRTALMLAVLLATASRSAAQGAPPRVRVSGDPALLSITTAVAGSAPTGVSDVSTTYDVRVNASTVKKITARLSAPMPTGVTLTMTLAPPIGATSMGPVVLDAIARDMVVNITGVNSTHAITYQLNATAAAGVIMPSSVAVTFTLDNYP